MDILTLELLSAFITGNDEINAHLEAADELSAVSGAAQDLLADSLDITEPDFTVAERKRITTMSPVILVTQLQEIAHLLRAQNISLSCLVAAQALQAKNAAGPAVVDVDFSDVPEDDPYADLEERIKQAEAQPPAEPATEEASA